MAATWAQGLQYLPGDDLGVLELGGLVCLLVVPVADLSRMGRRHPCFFTVCMLQQSRRDS
jgi:hypothetical protein